MTWKKTKFQQMQDSMTANSLQKSLPKTSLKKQSSGWENTVSKLEKLSNEKYTVYQVDNNQFFYWDNPWEAQGVSPKTWKQEYTSKPETTIRILNRDTTPKEA